MNNQVKNEIFSLRKTIESAKGLYILSCRYDLKSRFTKPALFSENKAVKKQVKRLAKLAYKMNNDKTVY